MTDSAVSDQNPKNVLCFLDVVLWNGIDLEKLFIAVFLPIESRLHPDLVDCEPFLPKPFRNSPVINTKFLNDFRQLQNTIRLRPDKAVCNAIERTVIGLRSVST